MSTPTAVPTHGHRHDGETAVPYPACPDPHTTAGNPDTAGAYGGTGHTATPAAETRGTA